MRPSIVPPAVRLFPAFLLVVGIWAPRPAGAEVTQRAAGGSDYRQVALSANGRFLLRGQATGDACGTQPNVPTVTDLVVHDLETSRADCVNVDEAGRGVLGVHSFSFASSISADGQLVVFSSRADGLDARCNGNGRLYHVYLRNRATRRTECISITETGMPGNDHSGGAHISANGKVIVFTTWASNLFEGSNGGAQVVAVSLVNGARQGPISPVPAFLNPALWPLALRALSAEGRFVLFIACPGSTCHSFRHDRETGQTIRVDPGAIGQPGNIVGSGLGLSTDGRFAVFWTTATDLVPGVASGIAQIYRRDLATGEVLLVSRGLTGAPADAGREPTSDFDIRSQFFDISGDGRFVVFSSPATNLVANDTNGRWDVFVADLSTGISRITRLSVGTDGLTEGNGNSASPYGPRISAAGGIVAFGSDATNLDPSRPGPGVFIARIPSVFENTVLTGAGFGGGPHVRGLAISGAVDPVKTFFAYDPTVTGGVTVARGDIDDDGVPDIVTGAGPRLQRRPLGDRRGRTAVSDRARELPCV